MDNRLSATRQSVPLRTAFRVALVAAGALAVGQVTANVPGAPASLAVPVVEAAGDNGWRHVAFRGTSWALAGVVHVYGSFRTNGKQIWLDSVVHCRPYGTINLSWNWCGVWNNGATWNSDPPWVEFAVNFSESINVPFGNIYQNKYATRLRFMPDGSESGEYTMNDY